MNMLALLLAFWPFDCPECQKPLNFCPALLATNQYSSTELVRVCAFDNTQTLASFFFIFEGFPEGAKIEMPNVPYFQYVQNPVYVACDGKAFVIAQITPEAILPAALNISPKVNTATYIVEANMAP